MADVAAGVAGAIAPLEFRPGLTIADNPPGGPSQLTLVGELDFATAPQFESALQRFAGTVLIDCRALRFIDAAGIGALVRARFGAREIRLVNASAMTRKVITIVGLSSVLLSERTPLPVG